ncbi:hypothetical protein PVA17_02895 [Lysinibacillus sp. CNPSo 3705]|uniref:hypothetical protein n=1 Tax=Lysinibacillus sp. CNPSo 3705 TaxID=3028148 RepID=UPI002364206C|nr:hypothetical protein [Lysinibacillus sp. CNPSo 3705]MDD1501720.1 hypothetical protein [Lysinibacillus sp. CNPSo 3705]
MSVEIYNRERSVESIQFEKLLTSESNKKSFSSIENTEQYVKQMGIENIKPYVVGDDVQFSNNVKEQAFEGMQVFTLNDQESLKQKVILYIHGGVVLGRINL